jgi:hypothetical protein
MNAATRALLVLAALASLTYAAPVVDGSVADWGIVVADNNGSNFAGLSVGGLLGFHLEDQSDTAGHSALLGPNRGGQDYDAEFMAAASDGTKLYVVVVTGQRPDNGFSYYGPGDLRITTSGGEYGIEVGGGVGGNGGAAITEGADGATYLLNSGGFTTGTIATNAAQDAGTIWKNPTWILDPITPQGPTQMQLTGGTYKGLADYVFTRNSFSTQHAIIELSFDLSAFGGETLIGVYWRPSCGNDELNVYPTTQVPEPGTLALAGFGVALLLARRVRRVRG